MVRSPFSASSATFDLKTYDGYIVMPLCRKVANLWEVRSSLSKGWIYRILFGVDNQILVLLHGFMKKAQTTPKKEIGTAQRRWKDYKKRKYMESG